VLRARQILFESARSAPQAGSEPGEHDGSPNGASGIPAAAVTPAAARWWFLLLALIVDQQVRETRPVGAGHGFGEWRTRATTATHILLFRRRRTSAIADWTNQCPQCVSSWWSSRPATSSSVAGVAAHAGGAEAAQRRPRCRPSTARSHHEPALRAGPGDCITPKAVAVPWWLLRSGSDSPAPTELRLSWGGGGPKRHRGRNRSHSPGDRESGDSIVAVRAPREAGGTQIKISLAPGSLPWRYSMGVTWD
jgi:hypothetical protein